MASRFWVGGTGTWDASATAHWSATTGGAAGASAPTSADTATFDANSGTGSCTTAAGAVCLTGTLNSSTLALTLGANLTSSAQFSFTLGALTLSTYTLTCTTFNANNSNVRSIAFGTGNITLTGSATTIWDMGVASNFTYTGTPTVNCTYAGATGSRLIRTNSTGNTEANAVSFNISAGTDTLNFAAVCKSLNFTGFAGTITNNAWSIYGNLTLPVGGTLSAGTNTTTFGATSGTQQITTNNKTVDFPLTFNGIGGTWVFQDALTLGSTRAFTFTNGIVRLKAGVTSTVGTFVTSGANMKYLYSTTAGLTATISKASGSVTTSNLTIKDITATGGATWTALWSNNNVDAGDNSGWFFGDPPIINAVEYTYGLRSFTQPRRF